MATALMDAHDDVEDVDGVRERDSLMIARDRNLLMLAFGSWGRCSMVAIGHLMRRALQHARIEPDSGSSSRELRKRCV
jgi:hypothetical protein